MGKLEKLSDIRCFSGWQKQYSHKSTSTNCTMTFSIFLPPQADKKPVPILYWLSGLTCTDENFVQKAGAQRVAAELGIAIVCADTSPRGNDVADDKEQAYDLGLGAGFYLNATQAPWVSHYNMYDYVYIELPKLIEQNFPVSDARSISGHSMGGHGALCIGIKNREKYRSISAFAPIANPINCAWGKKAFSEYLGHDQSVWTEYDFLSLITKIEKTLENDTQPTPILVDQGSADNFLDDQLSFSKLEKIAKNKNLNITTRLQPGYDHSYFFISSFIEEHLRFHARSLF